MNIPQIRISQTFARLSIEKQHGSFDIQQPHADVQIKNTFPRMEMSKDRGQLLIDQSQAWAAYGIMSPIDWTTQIANHIKHVVVPEAISNIAQNGDLLGDVARSGVTLADIARQKSRAVRDLNVVGEASALNVSMEYVPDELHVSLREGVADAQITPRKPVIHYKPGQVMIQQEQYHSISIEWVGQQVDLTL